MAANRGLDVTSSLLSMAGMNTTSIQWGAWSSAGMASESVLRRLDRIGQGSLSPQQGLNSLAAVLRGCGSRLHPPTMCCNPFNWDRLIANMDQSEGVDRSEGVREGRAMFSEFEGGRRLGDRSLTPQLQRQHRPSLAVGYWYQNPRTSCRGVRPRDRWMRSHG